MVQHNEEIIIVCKYSSTCNGNCIKCKWLLKELKILTLKDVNNMEINEPIRTCDCG